MHEIADHYVYAAGNTSAIEYGASDTTVVQHSLGAIMKNNTILLERVAVTDSKDGTREADTSTEDE